MLPACAPWLPPVGGTRPAWCIRCIYMRLRDQAKRKSSSNRLIEVTALRWRGQQPLMHCCRNAEVMVDRPTTELYLQQFSGFVVADRRERGGLHGNNLHGMTSFWRPF